MNQKNKVLQLAKKKASKLKKLRSDSRYFKVIGRLKKEGLLDAPVRVSSQKLLFEEILWVGKHIEPRVLELLPALVLKRPGIFLIQEFSDELALAAKKLKKGDLDFYYQGIHLSQCEEWLALVGQKGKLPTVSKSFRFRRKDHELLESLSSHLKISKTEVIRQALRAMKLNIGRH